MGTTLDTFNEWSFRNHTHLDRHLSILQRQANIFNDYVKLCMNHPANSDDFQAELVRLHGSIILLVDEMKETNEDFVQDCDDFKDVLSTLKREMMKHYADK